MKCDTCDGGGGWQDYVDTHPLPYQICPTCDGKGKMGFMSWFWINAPIWFVEWYGDWRYPREE